LGIFEIPIEVSYQEELLSRIKKLWAYELVLPKCHLIPNFNIYLSLLEIPAQKESWF
jgi:hypothetical protein